MPILLPHRFHRGYIKFLKFDVKMKNIKKFKLIYNLKALTDCYQMAYETLLNISAFAQKV